MTDEKKTDSNNEDAEFWASTKNHLNEAARNIEEFSREWKEFLAESREIIKLQRMENDRRTAENDRRTAENNRRTAENDRRTVEDERRTAEHERRTAEHERRTAEHDRQMAEIKEQLADAGKKISNLGSQCGDLGNKFGDFTEGMAMASIERIMEEDLDADYFGDYTDAGKKELGRLQIDAWGVARNGSRTVYLVEVKSKFRSEHIQQVRNQVRKFRLYKTEYKDYRICAMIAAVDINDHQRREIWKADMHVVDAADGVFRLAERPDEFQGEEGPRKDVPNFRMIPGGLTDGKQSQHGN